MVEENHRNETPDSIELYTIPNVAPGQTGFWNATIVPDWGIPLQGGWALILNKKLKEIIDIKEVIFAICLNNDDFVATVFIVIFLNNKEFIKSSYISISTLIFSCIGLITLK